MACAYHLCPTARSDKLPLFRFPKEKDRALIWATNSDRFDIKELILKGALHRVYEKRLCSLHFERPCFLNDLKKSLIRLAIPTIFQGKEKQTKYTMYSPERESTEINKNSDSQNKDCDKSQITIAELIEETVGVDIAEGTQEYFVDGDDVSQIITDENVVTENVNTDTSGVSLPVENETAIDNDNNSISSEINEDLFSNRIKTSTVPLHISSTVPSANIFSVEPATLNDLWSLSVSSIYKSNAKKLICRLCAEIVPKKCMMYLFSRVSQTKEFVRKIRQLLPSWQPPREEDDLPKWICFTCCETLNYCNKAVWKFTTANMKLTHMPSIKPKKCKEKEVPVTRNVSPKTTRETQQGSDDIHGEDAPDYDDCPDNDDTPGNDDTPDNDYTPENEDIQDVSQYQYSAKDEVFQETPFEKQLFHLFESIVDHNKEQSLVSNSQQRKSGQSKLTTKHCQRNPKTESCSNLLDLRCSHCSRAFYNKRSAFHHKLNKHRFHIVARTSKATYEFHCKKKVKPCTGIQDLEKFFRERVQQENVTLGKRQIHEVNDKSELYTSSACSSKLIKTKHINQIDSSKDSSKTAENNILNTNSNEEQEQECPTITNEHCYFNSNI